MLRRIRLSTRVVNWKWCGQHERQGLADCWVACYMTHGEVVRTSCAEVCQLLHLQTSRCLLLWTDARMKPSSLGCRLLSVLSKCKVLEVALTKTAFCTRCRTVIKKSVVLTYSTDVSEQRSDEASDGLGSEAAVDFTTDHFSHISPDSNDNNLCLQSA
jgi:hypothetical protein